MRIALLLAACLSDCRPAVAQLQVDVDAAADEVTVRDAGPPPVGPPWKRHTIDAGSRGADGVRVADVNADGLPDLTTPWEEGGQTRLYVHPGVEKVRQPWPSVIVGRARAPEDAVLVDLDGDGRLDVATCCEGQEQAVYVHWSPSSPAALLDPAAWTTQVFPPTRRSSKWMYALPMQIDGAQGVDLVIGSKGPGASVSWLRAPVNPRRADQWEMRLLCDARWIMSLRSRDIDADGDQDIVFSDRKGAASGCWWLENPGDDNASTQPWNKRPIAGLNRQVMFLDLADLSGDGVEDCVCAVSQGDIVYARRLPTAQPTWQEESIRMPHGVGTGKAVAVGDLDVDGRPDVAVSCEHAENASGVFWLRRGEHGTWTAYDISGTVDGVKFDRMELLDFDHDGDLDVVTCEEVDNLGVVWYENPSRNASSVQSSSSP